MHPSEWANFKSKDKRENICSATCPVVVLVDDKEKRVYLPELKGPCSATFMPLVDMTTLHRSQLPVLQQGNGRCTALDDVLTTSLTEMFCNQIVVHDDNSMTIKDNSQEAISKLQIIMKSNNFLSKGKCPCQ